MNKQNDILLFGDLCSNDMSFGEHLARRGLNVCVARIQRGESSEAPALPEDYLIALKPEQIVNVTSAGQLVRLAQKSRLVVTFTGAFGFFLSWRWIFRNILRLPPVINIPTGSDFSELLAEKSRAGWFYRYFVRTCSLNQGWVYPDILKNIICNKIRNIAFMRYPYFLPDAESEQLSKHKGRLRFFHPSNIDFKINDPGKHRNSSKGNDRFIRAFIRALKDGLDAECVILDRGPDSKEARRIIEDSDFSDRFRWKDHLGREEMVQEYKTADIVVDQFDVGGLGGIAVEAMAMARPVLTYLQKNCLNIMYSEHPPVLNAQTEEEIFKQIMQHADTKELRKIGIEAKRWVYQNHSWETCLDQFLYHYTLLTGHQVVDYGWDRNPYSEKGNT